LVRSLGGWPAVKALRRTGDRGLSDERILGSGEFVERIVKEAEAKIRYQFSAQNQGKKISEFIANGCKNEGVSLEELKAGGRRGEVSRVRAQVAIGLVQTYGVSLAEVARQLGITTSAVSRIITRANK
jgi:hypothetical protein